MYVCMQCRNSTLTLTVNDLSASFTTGNCVSLIQQALIVSTLLSHSVLGEQARLA